MGVENQQKINQKAIKEAVKNNIDFGCILNSSWADLGDDFGAKLGVKFDGMCGVCGALFRSEIYPKSHAPKTSTKGTESEKAGGRGWTPLSRS